MTDASSDKPSAFWQFSLCFYAAAGVADACLQLQEARDADVNILLYLLFLSRHGRMLSPADIARMEALVGPWREQVVQPLRACRRSTKAPPAAFADDDAAALHLAIKRLELEAERLQQLCLERNLRAPTLGTAHSDRRACAIHNLAAYADALGCLPAGPVEVLLRRLDDS